MSTVTQFYVRMKTYNPVTPGEETHYFSTGGKQPRTFATVNVNVGSFPDTVHFKRKVKVPGNYSINMFREGKTFGDSQAGFGEVRLINADGGLDDLLLHHFDGRSIDIWKGTYNEENPTTLELELWFTGVLETSEFTYSKTEPALLILRIRDKWANLQVPIQTTKYAGTNSGATGYEGTVDTIKGRPKPLAFGRIYEAPAVLVNSSTRTYQLHDGAVESIDAVYDKGVALTLDTAAAGSTSGNYATPAAMVGATIGAGKYVTCRAYGLFRLETSPVGDITVDFKGDDDASDGYVDTISGIIARIVERYTLLTSSDLDDTSFLTLDGDFGVEVGIYITDERNVDEVVMELLNSGGAYGVFSNVGELVVGQLKTPSGSPVATIRKRDIVEIERRVLNDTDRGIPAYRVELGYKKNYLVRDAGSLAGSVSDDRRTFIGLEYRTAIDTDSSVQTASPLAAVIKRNSLITTETDALNEADRLLDIYSVRRDYYIITVDDDKFSLGIDDVVSLQIDRFGLDSGKLFRVLGITNEAETNHMIIHLWG